MTQNPIKTQLNLQHIHLDGTYIYIQFTLPEMGVAIFLLGHIKAFVLSLYIQLSVMQLSTKSKIFY